ncbi:MAG TPA: BatA domain-containing protein, partial [Myxococcota bacterium]
MNLAFLDAGLLGGLLVAALPTLIHLISKRRARRVKWAPMELLLRSQKRTARSIRLRQLLLLLVRTLLLACAALAVARPVLRASQVHKTTGAPL